MKNECNFINSYFSEVSWLIFTMEHLLSGRLNSNTASPILMSFHWSSWYGSELKVLTTIFGLKLKLIFENLSNLPNMPLPKVQQTLTFRIFKNRDRIRIGFVMTFNVRKMKRIRVELFKSLNIAHWFVKAVIFPIHVDFTKWWNHRDNIRI